MLECSTVLTQWRRKKCGNYSAVFFGFFSFFVMVLFFFSFFFSYFNSLFSHCFIWVVLAHLIKLCAHVHVLNCHVHHQRYHIIRHRAHFIPYGMFVFVICFSLNFWYVLGLYYRLHSIVCELCPFICVFFLHHHQVGSLMIELIDHWFLMSSL